MESLISFNFGTTRGWITFIEKRPFKKFSRFDSYLNRLKVSPADSKILEEIAKKSNKLKNAKTLEQKIILEMEIDKLVRNPADGGSAFPLLAYKATVEREEMF